MDKMDQPNVGNIEPEPAPHRDQRGTYAGPDGGRLLGSDRGHGDQAAQENSEVERPVLPS